MGRIISGRTAFIAAVVGLAGVVGGLWWMIEAFCLSCTLTERRAFDNAMAVTALSFLLLAATVVVAIKAIRRSDGRRWAITALWPAGIPVAAAIGVPVLLLVLGF